MLNFEEGSLVLCGAKSKRNYGIPCRQPAMKNGRCRLHGGKCTGPKTLEGRMRCKYSRWRHGFYSKESLEEKASVNNLIKSILILQY